MAAAGGVCAACDAACAAGAWAPRLRAARLCAACAAVPAPRGFLAWLASPGACPDAPPHAAALHAALAAGLARVGGAAHVALRRGGGGGGPCAVAPSDAGWAMHHGAPRAEAPRDVLALLRASERVGAALDAWLTPRAGAGAGGGAGAGAGADEASDEGEIVLRPWMEMHPARELRAFVRRGAPLAVAARRPEAHARAPAAGGAAAAAADAADAALRKAALAFLAAALPLAPLRTCVADFYVDSRGRGWLLDFAPLRAGAVHCLSFSEEELGLVRGAPCEGCRDGGAGGAAGADGAQAEPPLPPPPAWRMLPLDGDCGGAAPAAAGPAPPPEAVDVAALFSLRAPAMTANRFPDELLLLSAATGSSVAALLEDLEAAVRKAGLGGADGEPLMQSADDDSDDGSGGEARGR